MTSTIRRLVLIGATACALLATAYVLVMDSVQSLSAAESAHRAKAWTQALVTQVTDLADVINGAAPSSTSRAYLEQARSTDDVWQYRLYDKAGKLVVKSGQIGQPNIYAEALGDVRPSAVREVAASGIFVKSRAGRADVEPDVIGEAIVPIVIDRELHGYLLLEIDETKRRDSTQSVITKLAATLLGLLLLAFGAPAVAFLRQTRKKERAEDQLEYLAYHDGLTGLKNRSSISRILDHTISETAAGLSCAVHMIDLDNFKGINDTKGHDAGDMLLQEVAKRLVKVCEGSAEVGRLGGDEFVIIQRNVRKSSQVEALAQQIINTMKKPVSFNGAELDTGASIGASLHPIDGKTSADLLKSADTALYVAKRDGRGCYRMFKPEYDAKMQRRSAVEAKVRQALIHGGFTLAYQPIFNLATKRIVSLEALLRLHDGELGHITPGEFIPIAEEAGLIEEVGDWVIAEACRSLALLPSQLRLAINLSAVQFYRGDVVSTVMKAIAATKIDPRRLELEITESLLLKNSAEVQDKIGRLKALGCTLALDDFGSGYSSLSYLWRYPFDKIKIDREFVAALSSNPDVEGIVEIILHLAKKLKMIVTAEGIETYDQELILASLGCDQVQGFLYSKPVSMADLAPFFLRDFYSNAAAHPPKLVTSQGAA
jgi:diguanylate cyclase (GGDEF)-like protein